MRLHTRRTERVNNGRNGAYGVNFGKQEHVMRKICKQFGVGRGRADKRGRTRRSIFVDAFFAASRRRRQQRWRPCESRQKYETPIAPPPYRSWIPRVYRYTVHIAYIILYSVERRRAILKLPRPHLLTRRLSPARRIPFTAIATEHSLPKSSNLNSYAIFI